MARSSGEETAAESILMSDGLDATSISRGSSRPRSDDYTDEEDLYYDYPRASTARHATSLNRVLNFVGINRRRRRGDYDYHSSSSAEALHGLLARPSSRRRVQRETRTCRKGFAIGTARKALLLIPLVVLLLFGILHVVQSILGTAQLLWDYDEDDLFLPDWGRPGRAGYGLTQYPTDATRDVLPIACHSHNDYWRRVPLFEALHWGCTSVEADVWLYDDDLFVGHNTQSLTRARSFTNLYIQPLVELLDTMNKPGNFSNGTSNGVFDAAPEQPLVLLVDIKSDPYSTYRLLEEQLKPLRDKDYLTYHNGTHFIQRAINVVGTGNTPFDLVRAKTKRREIFFDAPLDLFWEVPASPIVLRDALDDRAIKQDYATAMSQAPANITAHNLLNANHKTPPSAGQQAQGQGHIGVDSSFTADDFDTSNSYYASTSFAQSIGFLWRGRLSPRQMELVRGQIRGARKRGLKVRYWDTPAWPASARNHLWQVLVDEGADMLNVDDLKAAATEDWRRRVHRWWS